MREVEDEDLCKQPSSIEYKFSHEFLWLLQLDRSSTNSPVFLSRFHHKAATSPSYKTPRQVKLYPTLDRYITRRTTMRPAQTFMALTALAGVIATPVETSTDVDWEAVADEIAAAHGIEVVNQPTDDVSIQATSCYSDGVEWEAYSRTWALEHAAKWCNDINPGAYRSGQTKWHCYKWNERLVAQRRNVFGIRNDQGKSSDLSKDACFRFFRGLINACSHGGTNSNGAWWWR
jgi:hypothetical protein